MLKLTQNILNIIPSTIGVFDFKVKAKTRSQIENEILFYMTIESEEDAGKKAYNIEENNPPNFK